jgi:hypothetical protein
MQVIAFLYNGPPTCGDFAFGLSTQQLMWIVVVVVGALMGLTLPFYDETPPPHPPRPLREFVAQLYDAAAALAPHGTPPLTPHACPPLT